MGIVDGLVLVAILAAGEPVAAAGRVYAFEWLPLGAHSAVLREYERAGGVEIRRYNAMGDEERLAAALRDVSRMPEIVAIAFGPVVSQKAREICPAAKPIVLFAPGTLGTNGIRIDCEAGPRQVLEAAVRLRPGMKRLGAIYTSGFGPNVELADRLGQEARGQGIVFVSVTVPHGLCRTDSDFEKALEQLEAGGNCDVLYLPDDPNVSRFSAVVYRFCTTEGIATLGTDATRGKGCAAAFVRDCEGIGRNLAAVVRALLESREPESALLRVPPKLVLEGSG